MRTLTLSSVIPLKFVLKVVSYESLLCIRPPELQYIP